MSGSEACIKQIIKQWSSVLALSICKSSAMTSAEIGAKVKSIKKKDFENAKGFFVEALKEMDKYDKGIVGKMFSSYSNVISEYSNDLNFPQIFSEILKNSHDIFSFPLTTDKNKAKAIHTESLIETKEISELEKLKCHVFQFLSKILDKAESSEDVNLSLVTKGIIEIVFKFLEYNQPKKIRNSAGRIITVLSVSNQHCKEITDLFWKRFSKCKRDDDFRNFSSFIDGIIGLKLSLDTNEKSVHAISFLKSFCDSSKKITRGVLRMQFLDALYKIIQRLNNCETANTNEEYINQLSNIWNIVENWSTKPKHTEFCYKFMQNLLSNSGDSFYEFERVNHFLDLLISYGSKNVQEFLNLIPSFIKSVKKNYLESENYKIAVNSIIDFMFPLKEKIRSIKFKNNEGINCSINVLIGIGINNIEHLIDFIKSVFEINTEVKQNEQQKVLKSICYQAISGIAQNKPEVLQQYNDYILSLIEPILLDSKSDEYIHVIESFPYIHSSDDKKNAKIVETLYMFCMSSSDMGCSNLAIKSISSYIENNISLNNNINLPIRFIKELIKSIPLLEICDFLKSISFISLLTKSFITMLSKYRNMFQDVKDNKLQLKENDWLKLRRKIDKYCLLCSLSKEEDVKNTIIEYLNYFDSNIINDFENIVLTNEYYSLTKLFNSDKNEKDIINLFNILYNENTESSNVFFNFLIKYYQNNNQKINNDLSFRMLICMSKLCKETNEKSKEFFGLIFDMFCKNPNSLENFSIIDSLHYTNWISLLTEFDNYSSKNLKEYWNQYVTIYYIISKKPEFEEQISNENLQTFYRSLFKGLWDDFKQEEKPYALTGKVFEIMYTFLEKSTNKLITLNTKEIDIFLSLLPKIMPCNEDKKISFSIANSYLLALCSVFKYHFFEDKSLFNNFLKYIVDFNKLFINDEHIQSMICQLMTSILINQPQSITEMFKLNYIDDDSFVSSLILALSNAYQACDNFNDKYENGLSYLFATLLLHLTNNSILPRQSSFKLMSLMIIKSDDYFLTKVPNSLIMPMTSQTKIGFVIQSNQFISFASKSIKQDIIYTTFDILTNNQQLNNILLSKLINFIPVIYNVKPLEETLLMLMKLSSNCNHSDVLVSDSIKTLWNEYIKIFKEKDSSKIFDLINYVFNFGTSQPSMICEQTRQSVIILSYVFNLFNEETSKFLIDIILKKYKFELPEINLLEEFFNKASIRFEPSNEEIVASNALSQILLMINNRKLFIDLFGNNLSILVIFSIISRSEESYAIGKFHPLLDSLVDATLFRFAENSSKYSSNLNLLQEKSFMKSAATLDESYIIVLEDHSRNILAYDEELIRLFSELFSQLTPNFKEEFISKLLPLAFQVAPKYERNFELFLMLLALGKEYSKNTQFYLLLYVLYLFKSNRSDIIDCLVDCIVSHISKCEEIDNEETYLTLTIFILLLALNVKQTNLGFHLMNLISVIIDKICSIEEIKESISKEIINYFKKFNGDTYLTSVFIQYLSELPSFGCKSNEVIIKCLYSLSKIYQTKENWCELLSILIDGTRSFIAQKCGIEVPKILTHLEYTTIDEFIDIIISKFNEESQIKFTISFLCNIVRKFKNSDLNKDSTIILLISSILDKITIQFEPSFNDSLIMFVSLVSLTCNELGKSAAPIIIHSLIKNSSHEIEPSTYCYTISQTRFIESKFKPYNSQQEITKFIIEPTCLPEFPLFNFNGIETTIIYDLWDLISSKIK